MKKPGRGPSSSRPKSWGGGLTEWSSETRWNALVGFTAIGASGKKGVPVESIEKEKKQKREGVKCNFLVFDSTLFWTACPEISLMGVVGGWGSQIETGWGKILLGFGGLGEGNVSFVQNHNRRGICEVIGGIVVIWGGVVGAQRLRPRGLQKVEDLVVKWSQNLVASWFCAIRKEEKMRARKEEGVFRARRGTPNEKQFPCSREVSGILVPKGSLLGAKTLVF